MAVPDRERLPPTLATVRSWKDDKGWGVLIPDGSSERVWTHFSAIDSPGYRSLEPGERVWLVAERPGQDSYPLRALTVRRLDADGRPVESRAVPAPAEPPEAAGFRSSLTIRWRDGRVPTFPPRGSTPGSQ